MYIGMDTLVLLSVAQFKGNKVTRNSKPDKLQELMTWWTHGEANDSVATTLLQHVVLQAEEKVPTVANRYT